MKIIISLIVLVTTLNITAQVGKPFPPLKGVTLDEKPFVIPTDTKGKSTIICIAYSKRAEDALHAWLSPIYNQFIAKTGMMDDLFDLNVLFIPMFTGIHQISENMALKQLKDGTDKIYYKHIICYHGSIHPYKEELNFEEKEFPYFYILDKEGKIIYTTKGLYSEKKMEEIADKIE